MVGEKFGNFKADAHMLNLYLKDKEIDLRLTEYRSLSTKTVLLLRDLDIFYKLCIVLDDTAVHD